MIYKIKDIKDTRMSKTGKKMIMAVLTDGKKDYNVTLFDVDAMVGDEVDGKMGEYDEKWKNYKFRLLKVKHTKDSKAGITDDARQSNIAFESFYASTANLLQGKNEGKVIAITWQLHTYLMKGKWILLASDEQVKKIMAKFKDYDVARKIVFDKYNVPYLHMLTYEQAEEILKDA